MKKLLSVLLAVIMVLSVFTVSASAKTMTKAEVVKFYHSVLKETARNNKVVVVKNDWKEKDEADFSGLSGLDLQVTKNVYSYTDGVWYENTDETYYYGVRDEYEDAEYTDLYMEFRIGNKLDGGYEVKSATYANNKIVIELEDNDELYASFKTTITLANDNSIKTITEELCEEYTDYSLLKDIPFDATYEVVNNYTFSYDKVPAKSLKLSETSVTLGYEDTAEITYTIGPENASFKQVEAYPVYDENDELIAYAYTEDGIIYIEECAEGTGTMEVYTISGEILATCEVTVEYSFFDKINIMFDDIFFWLEMIFGIWTF